jgi:hypothetical protein
MEGDFDEQGDRAGCGETEERSCWGLEGNDCWSGATGCATVGDTIVGLGGSVWDSVAEALGWNNSAPGASVWDSAAAAWACISRWAFRSSFRSRRRCLPTRWYHSREAAQHFSRFLEESQCYLQMFFDKPMKISLISCHTFNVCFLPWSPHLKVSMIT